jgi:signal transduction histidine kinase/ActR/RegA family two-component response regulator
MANRECDPLVLPDSTGEAQPSEDFRPLALRKSLGLVEQPSLEPELAEGILERKCTERDMLQYFLEIESSREYLHRTRREAELTAQAKSEFLAMMSHEMRTPLNGIIGMTAVLLSHNLSEQDRDCVETIRHSGEVLMAVIDDILDLSKIEAGRLELECVELNVAAVIDEAIQVVKTSAARKPLKLVTCIDPDVPKTLRGDRIRLRQILLNLLSNAIKFTPAGKIELRASVKPAGDSGFELFFSVTDEGIGISEAQQRNLFQPFSQADAHINRQFGGTGLGLTICKMLVELMGGKIGVTSRLGQGSCFWFTIKMLPSENAAAQVSGWTGSQTALRSLLGACGESAGAPGSSISRSPTPAAPVKNSRLLLVDDNAVNQKVAVMMLKKLGYHADVAKNGQEALQLIDERHYDLVFMDCIMPELDGLETTRILRSKGGYAATVPVIAMTANAFIEDRKACLAAGMSDYLSKPVRESELSRKLECWLPAAGQPEAMAG